MLKILRQNILQKQMCLYKIAAYSKYFYNLLTANLRFCSDV